MNIVVYNQAKELLDNLETNVLKSVSGIFSVSELKEMFTSMYYERLIIDVTAIRDYKSSKVLQDLSKQFDMSKVILVLENTPDGVNPSFISGIISLGIYNFTRNKEGILYLLKNANSYNDVAHLHNPDKAIEAAGPVQRVAVNQKIVGFLNVTESAGASTLIYMLVKNMQKITKCIAIEVDKFDFKYFRNPDMISTTKDELEEVITSKYSNYSVILIDLNEYKDPSICTDIVYLIEPSIIKMNKLTSKSTDFTANLRPEKVILNKSNISPKSVLDFEQETGLKIFKNIRSINDRATMQEDIIDLIDKLHLITDQDALKNMKPKPKRFFG